MDGPAHEHFPRRPAAVAARNPMPPQFGSAAVDLILGPPPCCGTVRVGHVADPSYRELLGAKRTGIEDDRVDAIKPAQRRGGDGQHTVVFGKATTEHGRERLATGTGGLGGGDQ